MKLESEEHGPNLSIPKGSTQFLGRTEASLSTSSVPPDRTVSRRHLSLDAIQSTSSSETDNDPIDQTALSFEVIGKNPILVVHGGDGGERKIYRPSEKGVLREGDRLSLSLRNPRFFRVKEVEGGIREAVRRREEKTMNRRREKEKEIETEMCLGGGGGEAQIGETELGFHGDLPEVDPVKEFGFLVRGHEFDNFPRQMVRSIKDWNWFLDDPEVSSDEEDLDEEINKRRKGKREKKRKGEEMDNELWMGESEDEKASVVEVGGGKKRNYFTRSKDLKKQNKDTSSSQTAWQLKAVPEIEEEDDETLGGFIVKDEEIENENDEEEEVEELEEDEYDEDAED